MPHRLGHRLIGITLFIVAASAQAGDWSAFRGPTGDGVGTETNLPTTWGPKQNIIWKAPLPEPGNGSPIVVRGNVYVTGPKDEGRQRILYCFDRTTGAEKWSRSVAFPEVELTHKTNPFCAPTPVSDGERIFVWHGSAGMHCYDLDGKPIWNRDLGTFKHIWGYASSPVVHGDSIIQLCGPGERTFLIALDRKSGKTLWQTDEPGGHAGEKPYVGSWITPVFYQDSAKKRRMLVGLQSRAGVFDPDTGKLLASSDGLKHDGGHELVYSSPMVGNGVGVVFGGFSGPAIGFRLEPAGDAPIGQRLWRTYKGNPQRIGTGVVVGSNLFMANADGPGSIECIDVETGKERWKQPRAGAGAFWGSIILTDGHCYVTGQTGATVVFKPNPERYEEIAINKLDEHTNATPAFSDGHIFIRTFRHLYCIGN